jgi:hypothetical protein
VDDIVIDNHDDNGENQSVLSPHTSVYGCMPVCFGTNGWMTTVRLNTLYKRAFSPALRPCACLHIVFATYVRNDLCVNHQVEAAASCWRLFAKSAAPSAPTNLTLSHGMPLFSPERMSLMSMRMSIIMYF